MRGGDDGEGFVDEDEAGCGWRDDGSGVLVINHKCRQYSAFLGGALQCRDCGSTRQAARSTQCTSRTAGGKLMPTKCAVCGADGKYHQEGPLDI